MRRLMLLRHAKSDWSAAGQRDHERILAPRGREAAPLVGAYMAQHGLTPDKALVSTARRARETWDLVAPAFRKQPAVAYEDRIYEASPKAILSALQETEAGMHALLVVGHNPGLQELSKLLMASGDIDARQRLIEKYPTAGLAVIDFPVDSWSDLHPHGGRLDRFVTPRSLESVPD
jgi:phosphohistidine phosphatase